MNLSPPKLSAVVCCYNEEHSLHELLRRLPAAVSTIYGDDYEIVLVDDGSTDKTWEIIAAAAASDTRIVGVRLSRNFGHQAALTAGLERSTGERIFILDADLQDPPELIVEFHNRLENGADVAFGQRTERLGETAFKRTTAALFYMTLNRFSDTPIHESVGDFRMVTRSALDVYLSLPESQRFSRGLFSWLGGNQVAVPYCRDPRFAGETHYTLARMLRLATDALTSFSIVPLRFCGYLGLFSMGIAFCLFVYVATSYLFFGTQRGWSSLTAIVVFFGSVQLLSLSIIGEYIGRVFMQNKSRPIYITTETRNERDSDRTKRHGLDLRAPTRRP